MEIIPIMDKTRNVPHLFSIKFFTKNICKTVFHDVLSDMCVPTFFTETDKYSFIPYVQLFLFNPNQWK